MISKIRLNENNLTVKFKCGCNVVFEKRRETDPIDFKINCKHTRCRKHQHGNTEILREAVKRKDRIVRVEREKFLKIQEEYCNEQF